MNIHVLTLNFNKNRPYSRFGFRNELSLLEQIFCQYLQSAAYQSVFFESGPTMNDSPYWRFICLNLDKHSQEHPFCNAFALSLDLRMISEKLLKS